MSTGLSTGEILQAVLERIPIGESFDYTGTEASIVKVSERYIDVWIGNKAMLIPRKVQAMIEVAEEAGYRVTYTFKYEHPELVERKKEIKQVGLGRWIDQPV